ncbi:hypothetical protein GOP47_0014101 [Adiantum capillus-veneris]|uniref:Uncharacterized protein n=1 Tax=Adiantum capillus-veneris TaxID=13818 RepID=A0A9D4UPS3_ADICA|nr:hypothetical protein GOP47_0014101 [Adiantum capillus-veneris]
MENLDHNKIKKEKDDLLTGIKDVKDDFSTNVKDPAKPSSSMTDENEYAVIVPGEKVLQENKYRSTDGEKRVKIMENGIATFLKLRGFFEVVQKQHPESHLELQQVDGNWRVWCGVCKKLLRPDKSGKAIHNIQRQHFTSARHKKKLHLSLQAEEEAVEIQRKNAAAEDSGTHDNEQGDVKD